MYKEQHEDRIRFSFTHFVLLSLFHSFYFLKNLTVNWLDSKCKPIVTKVNLASLQRIFSRFHCESCQQIWPIIHQCLTYTIQFLQLSSFPHVYTLLIVNNLHHFLIFFFIYILRSYDSQKLQKMEIKGGKLKEK